MNTCSYITVAYPVFTQAAHKVLGTRGWPVPVPLPSLLHPGQGMSKLHCPLTSSWVWPLGGSPCPTAVPLTRSQEFSSLHLLLSSGGVGGDGSSSFLVSALWTMP